jgi:hypothetical protein
MSIRDRLYSRVAEIPPAITDIAKVLWAAALMFFSLAGGWFYLNNLFGAVLFTVAGLLILLQRKVWLDAWWAKGAYAIAFGYTYVSFGLVLLAHRFA